MPPPQTVRVGDDIKPPVKKNVAPVYPPIAVTSHTQGAVILEATIGTDGKVKDTKILRSTKQLDDAAVTAVRAWDYRPALVNSKSKAMCRSSTSRFEAPSLRRASPTFYFGA